jgi:hypothetical protein
LRLQHLDEVKAFEKDFWDLNFNLKRSSNTRSIIERTIKLILQFAVHWS